MKTEIFPCLLSFDTKIFLVEESNKKTIFPEIKFMNRFEEGAYYLKKLNNLNSEIKITDISNNFSKYASLKKYDLNDIIDEFKLNNCNVIKVGSDKLNTKFGEFGIELYEEIGYGKIHYFLHKGNYLNAPTRIHSGCLKSELFQSMACDCKEELENSLLKIQNDGEGSILYLKQEPEHLFLKTLSQDNCFNIGRDFHQACWIFKDLGFKHIKLIT